MRTLAIETSTARGSLAILEDGELLFSEQFLADRSAGLFACLESAAAFLPACRQFAIGLGPGSYSGVRVAIAAAIGLKFTHPSAAVCGLSSFAALSTPKAEYFAVGDARRGGFYFAHFMQGAFVIDPELLELEAIFEKIALRPELPIFSSDAVPDVPRAQLAFPSAERIARLAAADQAIHARDALEPIYLRAPVITRPSNPLPPSATDRCQGARSADG